MKIFIVALFLITGLSCKRTLSHAEAEQQLMKAMHNYLINRPDYDSSKVKYEVIKVSYFEDKTFFECEFLVHLSQNGHDTTGQMNARISKDFSVVKRKW